MTEAYTLDNYSGVDTGSGIGAGGSYLLPEAGATERIELLSSVLGKPIALAYGRHIVGGNVMFQHVEGDYTTYFIALGEGEWDLLEALWINGKSEDVNDDSRIHFHKGTDGELGVETVPGTPNQKICQFYPTTFTPQLTFSRIAYLALKLANDPGSPDIALDVRGIYRTQKIRTFDAAGALASYGYSASPAWCTLDLLIRRLISPHGLVNQALTAAEKLRIDFPSFVDAATYCIADPGDGLARFESHYAFVDQTDLYRGLDQLLLTCRGYLIERSGKIALYIDKPRSSIFTVTRDAFREGSLSLPVKDLRSSANKILMKYRSLTSGAGDVAKDFQNASFEAADEDHQDQVGRIIPGEFDLGNSTPGRAARIGAYMRERGLRLDDQLSIALMQGGSGNNPIELEPGDVFTAPDDIDGWTLRDYEIQDITDEPDGGRQVFAQEYDAAVFVDTLSTPKLIFPTELEGDTTTPAGFTLAASANGMHLLFGVEFTTGRRTAIEAEFAYKFTTDLVTSLSLATPDKTTTVAATQFGARDSWTSDRAGRWFWAVRVRNSLGWSNWSTGAAALGTSTNYIDTRDLADTGPPSIWTVTASPGDDPNSVRVKVTRPTTNGRNLLRLVVQVRDTSGGAAWRELDANAGAAVTRYDGAAIAHEVADNGTKIKRTAGTGFGTALVGDLVLLDVRGGAFGVNYCQHGTIAAFLDASDTPVAVGSAVKILVVGGFRPQVNTDVRIRIVKPHWDWTTEGYLGALDGQGIWGKWIEGLEGDEFWSDQIKIEGDYTSIDARAWFENHYCMSDSSTAGGTTPTVSANAVTVRGTRSQITNYVTGPTPTNDPGSFSQRTYAGTPDAQSAAVELYFSYTQGANKATGFVLIITDGTATFRYFVRAIETAGTITHRIDIKRLHKDKTVTITIGALFTFAGGTVAKTPVSGWSFTPNSSSGSTIAATVVGELDWAGGNVWFDTEQYRNNIAPSNGYTASISINRVQAGAGAVHLELSTLSYSQGAYIATHLAVFLKTPDGTISLTTDHIVTLINLASLPGTFVIPYSLSTARDFKVGIAAVALTRSGYTFNSTFSQTLAALDNDTTLRAANATGAVVLAAGEKWVTTPLTMAQITADQNNYDFSGNESFLYRMSTDASRTITGIANGQSGRHVIILNIGGFDLVLANQNASSSAGNRIITGTGADLTISPDQSVHLIYDSTTARWRKSY